MEPAFIGGGVYEGDEGDDVSFERDDTMADININLQTAIVTLKDGILKFKRKLFEDTVSNNTTHTPSSMEAMIGFQSKFLYIISFWLSLLNCYLNN